MNRVPAARLGDRARCAKCHGELAAFDAPQPIASVEEFDAMIAKSPVPVLVDFWAEWCGPCRSVAPELERLAREKAGALLVAKVDTDAVGDVASRFGIRSIPTFVLFRGGREHRRVSGAMPARALAEQLGLG